MMSACIVSLTGDPMTLGHRDIIKRASKMFDNVTILMSPTSSKPGSILSFDEKKAIAENDLCADGVSNFTVRPIEGALVDQAKKLGISVIVRGLRNEQDLVYETDMSSVNRMLNPEVETVYLPCKPELSFVSSSMIRELCRLGKWREASQFCSYFATKLIKKSLTRVVAITGSIGCGKSYAQEIFEKNGWAVMDLDRENEEAVLKSCDCANEICQRILNIGYDVRYPGTDNVIDKKKLAEVVMKSKAAKDILESIAWPKLAYQVEEFISDWSWNENTKVAIQVPLLFEKGTEEFNKFFDKTVCIATKYDVQVKRLVETRGYSEEEAEKRIAMQMDVDEKAKLCDFIIDNNGTKEEFEKDVEDVISRL